MRSRLCSPSSRPASAWTVSAQTGTADGVAAIARGDYQRAVEILKPIADDWRSTDIVAQFLWRDSARRAAACRGPAARMRTVCPRGGQPRTSLRQRSFPHVSGLQPTRPGIRSRMSASRQYRIRSRVRAGHVRFRATPLDRIDPVCRDRDGRWSDAARGDGLRAAGLAVPAAAAHRTDHGSAGSACSALRRRVRVVPVLPLGGSWTLHWHLFEVVRGQIIRIDTPGSVVTVEGDAPPRPDAFDVREYAVVRAGDEGHVEWAVLEGTGSARRSGLSQTPNAVRCAMPEPRGTRQ